jgi:hypothetical protein
VERAQMAACECKNKGAMKMPVTTPKELCLYMLSELRHGAERSQKIYAEFGNAAQNPEIKEALDARELVSSQILNRLDECFKLIGGEAGEDQSAPARCVC